MGSFANTLFSMLLGWVQGLISMIWSALTSEDGNSFLQFIGKNWIKIAFILCVIGFITDLAVYIFRWQPYKVWRTFLRKRSKMRNTDLRETEKVVNAVPSKSEETVSEKSFSRYFAASGSDAADEKKESDIQEELQQWRETETEQEEPEIRPETAHGGYTVAADSPYRRPVAGTRRRRIRIRQILGDPDEDGEIHYISPQPIVDHKEAYHAPVYPEKWTGSREQDS